MKRREFLAGAISAAAFPIIARAAKPGRELFDRSACAIPDRFRDHPLFTTPHCGVNFGFLARRGYFSRPEVRRQPPLMRKAGANWVTLNTHFCQETFASRKVFLDFDWSSGERELVDMIRALHGEGLHIVLKPCLTSLDSAWMGLSWWKWDETQHTRHHYSPDPMKDRGFTICGKPAEAVMRKWSGGMKGER